MVYQIYLSSGWKTGVHKAPAGYKHKWIVIHRAAGVAAGFYTKREAEAALRYVKLNDTLKGFAW